MSAFADAVFVDGTGFDAYAIQRVTFRYTMRFVGTAAFYDQPGTGIEYQDVTATATVAAIPGLALRGNSP